MSINIPAVPIDSTGFYPLPSEYETALKEAEQLLATQADPSKDDEWQDAGNNQDVQLHRKDNTEDAYDVPWVKGYTIVESATPEQVLATIQLPAMRKKWDPRFEDGHRRWRTCLSQNTKPSDNLSVSRFQPSSATSPKATSSTR